MYARRVGVPGGNKFHLALGTIDISGRAKQGRKKISSHEPDVKRGAMGIILPSF